MQNPAQRRAFDANYQALKSIMAEWTSSLRYCDRTNILRGTGAGPSANGAVFLTASGPTPTVLDDAAVDVLVGAAGQDWFFAKVSGKTKDAVSGKLPNELIESLI